MHEVDPSTPLESGERSPRDRHRLLRGIGMGAIILLNIYTISGHLDKIDAGRAPDASCEVTVPAPGQLDHIGRQEREDENINPQDEIYDFVQDNSELNPEELVQKYSDTYAEKREVPAMEIYFDEGVLDDDWQEPEDESLLERQLLLGKVDNFLTVVNEYPAELLKSLEIQKIRIANIYDQYAGHYDSYDNEVLIEFDTFFSARDSLNNLRSLFAHEAFGHGVHRALYCQTDHWNDSKITRFNQGYKYLGDDFPKLPPKLFAYGHERLFVEPYGARAASEDIATIAAFTLETRGLIQEGDADYGSPLHKKQQIYVEQADALIPGFKELAERRTKILRRTPGHVTNQARLAELPPLENFDAASPVFDTFSTVDYIDRLETLPILDGAVYVDDYSKSRRTGYLIVRPAVHINPWGMIDRVHYETPEKTGAILIGAETFMFTHLDPSLDTLQNKFIRLMTKDDFKQNNQIIELDSKEADEFFARNYSMVRIPDPVTPKPDWYHDQP